MNTLERDNDGRDANGDDDQQQPIRPSSLSGLCLNENNRIVAKKALHSNIHYCSYRACSYLCESGHISKTTRHILTSDTVLLVQLNQLVLYCTKSVASVAGDIILLVWGAMTALEVGEKQRNIKTISVCASVDVEGFHLEVQHLLCPC